MRKWHAGIAQLVEQLIRKYGLILYQLDYIIFLTRDAHHIYATIHNNMQPTSTKSPQRNIKQQLANKITLNVTKNRLIHQRDWESPPFTLALLLACIFFYLFFSIIRANSWCHSNSQKRC